MPKQEISKAETSPFLGADFSKLIDPSKIMAEFKVPGFDMSALMEMQRKNIEMLTAVNQTIFENLRSFAQRQAELIRQGLEETMNHMSTVMSSPTAQDNIVRHAEVSKTVAEKYIAHVHDAAETFAKCNNHAMEAVRNRMSVGINELCGLVKTDHAT